MIIMIIVLSLIILLFENQDKFLDEEYLILRGKINHSNNESVVKCINDSYIIISPYDVYICGKLNPNIRLKK